MDTENSDSSALAESGFDLDRLDRVYRFIEREVSESRMPGAVLGIARGAEQISLKAFGFRDATQGTVMTADTLFWAASMTKPITAIGALALHEQGDLDLDAEIGDYLPEFRGRVIADHETLATRVPSRQPTVLDLMRHTAGIPEGLLGRTAVHALYADAVGDGMTALTGAEFRAGLGALPLLHEPGTVWHYGFGYDLLGLIIEDVTGMSLGSYLTQNVLGPLGMRDTRFGGPGDQAGRYAAPLPLDPDGAPQHLPDLAAARFDSGGAGLISTAGDYLAFVRMLLGRGQLAGRRIVGRKTVEFMLADGLGPGVDTGMLERPGWNRGHGFGLAVAVRRATGGAATAGSPGEVTWPGAAGTFWWADPAEDLGVVFMAHTPSRIQSAYQQKIKALVTQALI